MSTKEISISETDLDLLVTLLLQEERRCLRFAQNTKSGYGTAASASKESEWIDRAGTCNDLAYRLSERFI